MEFSSIVGGIPFISLFIFTGILVNLIQVSCYLTIWPVSKSTFRRINGAITELLWLEVVWLMEWWSGFEVKVHTDAKTSQLMGKEHAIIMPNHVSDSDTLLTWILAQSSFEALSDYPTPFWMTIFVEGTRLTADKLLEAQSFASSKGYPIPKNGIVTAVQSLRSFVPAIYDVTIAIPKQQPFFPTLLTFLKMQPCKVAVHIKRYSTKDLPESDQGIAQWCRNRFIAKDELLETFAATGTFDEEEITEFRRSTKSLIVTLIFASIFLVGGWIFLQRLSSGWQYPTLATIIGSVAIVVHIFIEFTKMPPPKIKATQICTQ
ncbi:hypothetical protein GOBAR_DD14982 [Gossypium barbadense]|nr:hypothetical protein GOBAR_DD14982 [Gossypium barbadense]